MFNKIKADIYEKIKTEDERGLGTKTTLSLKSSCFGYLDLLGGNDKFVNDKIRKEATHIFICLSKKINELLPSDYININGKFYIILLIDNPVQCNQTEIILKEAGDIE